MCIKGLDTLERYSQRIGFGTYMIGGCLIMSGVLAGVLQGWNSLAIGLIVGGGIAFIPAIGGKIVLERVRHLQEKDEEARNKVSEQYRDRISNL